MNTIQTGFLYSVIFAETKYKECGHFLGNKAFIRKNNRLAQIEFLKGNKIGNYKESLRDITIKVKLKSESENREEIETCMSLFDETRKFFLCDFAELNSAIDYVSENVIVPDPEADFLEKSERIFGFVGDKYRADYYAGLYEFGKGHTYSPETTESKEKNRLCLFWFLNEIGKHISDFLDFMFEQNRQLSPEEFWGNVKSNWCKKAEENMDEV